VEHDDSASAFRSVDGSDTHTLSAAHTNTVLQEQ
jgi:hypothetical protein